jgi:hypothetical protein
MFTKQNAASGMRAARPAPLYLEELEGRNLLAPVGIAGAGLSQLAGPSTQAIANRDLAAIVATLFPGVQTQGVGTATLPNPFTANATFGPGSGLNSPTATFAANSQATFSPPFVPFQILPSTGFANDLPAPIGVPNPVRNINAPPAIAGSQASLPPLYAYTQQDIKLSGGGTPAYYGEPPRTANFIPDEEEQTQIEASAADAQDTIQIIDAVFADESSLSPQR